jgi:hypothetical protein
LRDVAAAARQLSQAMKAAEGEAGGGGGSKGLGIQKAAISGVKEVLKSAYQAAADYSRAANDIKPINFGTSADRAKAFDDQLTRMAVRGGQNVDVLKKKFKETGVEIGVMPERVAATARALQKATYSNDSADAMRALGDEANDTDRSLEDMVEIGSALYTKLGVPMDKVGVAIKTIRNAAQDLQTIGGHIALEDTLVRLSPLLAKFGGGLRRAAATVGVIGKGKSPEVAEEEAALIFGSLERADPLLVTKAFRETGGDRNYKPYERDPATGRTRLKREALPMLQQRARKAPGGMGALIRLFGGGIAGVGAAETFLKLDFGEIATEEAKLEFAEDLQAIQESQDRGQLQHEPGAPRRGIERYRGLDLGTGGNKFRATKAGRRAQTDVERGNVELGVGDVTQDLRDRRNARYSGNRGAQAAVDTAGAYLPPLAGNVINLLETAASGVGAARDSITRPSSTPKIGLDDATINKLGQQLRQPTVPAPGPAAQAVESNKAAGRAAANF